MENCDLVLPVSRQVTHCLSAGTPDSGPRDAFRSDRELEILIIGGGPAGLSLGFELKKRGLAFLILEKGASVGESWRKMPRDLRLASPWKCNSLPGTERNDFPRHYQMSRAEFWNYLQRYAKSAALPVQTKTTVDGVEKSRDGRFRVQTSQGEFSSRFLINATGYFANPFTPEIPGASETKIPQLHVAAYNNPRQASSIIGKSNGLILIVGKRLSAGQIIIELAEAGFALALAHRSPIQYGVGPFGWWVLFRVFPWLESLKLMMKGNQALSNDVRMPGGLARRMIETNQVQTFPKIERFESDAVVFTDGRRLSPDLVLFATGFRAALDHLAQMDLSICAETGQPAVMNMESQSVPGLYFVGLDHGRNFQSRFLRGIRNDAAILAARLERKLSFANR